MQLAHKVLNQTLTTGEPNPGAFFVQLQSSAVIASHIAALGLNPNVFEDLDKLVNLNDPVLVRLGYTIKLAGQKYGTAAGKPVGWYATIAIHNSAIDAHWDGGSEAQPYGNPNTPA
jgi:hypothetical protein